MKTFDEQSADFWILCKKFTEVEILSWNIENFFDSLEFVTFGKISSVWIAYVINATVSESI